MKTKYPEFKANYPEFKNGSNLQELGNFNSIDYNLRDSNIIEMLKINNTDPIVDLSPLLYVNISDGIDISGNNNNLTFSTIFTSNDSFQLPNISSIKTALTNARCYDIFYDFEDNPRKIVFSELEYQYGLVIFRNAQKLLIFASPLSITNCGVLLNYLHAFTPSTVAGFNNTEFLLNGNSCTFGKKIYYTPGDYTYFTATAGMKPTGNMTIAFAYQTFNQYTNTHYLVTQEGSRGFTCYQNSTGNIIALFYFNNATYYITSTKTYNDGQEHMFIIKRDGTTISFQTDKEYTTAACAANNLEWTGVNYMMINQIQALNNSHFTGFISHLRMWSAAKTVAQVMAYDSANLIFNSPDCYHDYVADVDATIGGGKTYNQLYIEVGQDPSDATRYYERAVNFNPTNSEDSIYSLIDKRNWVGNSGSRLEVWTPSINWGADQYAWKLNFLSQVSVLKYVAATYMDRICILQNIISESQTSVCRSYPVIYCLTSDDTSIHTLSGVSRDTYFITGIVGDGVTDDATAINAALLAHSNACLMDNYAITKTPISIPSSTNFFISNSYIVRANNINNILIKNSDYDAGNINIGLIGFGNAVLDGNGSQQNRALWPQGNANFYKYHNSMFVTVTGLKEKNLLHRRSSGWTSAHQDVHNAIYEFNRYDNNNEQLNQDGVDFCFKSTRVKCRFLTGHTQDDIVALLNYPIGLSNCYQTQPGWSDGIMSDILVYGINVSINNLGNGNALRVYSDIGIIRVTGCDYKYHCKGATDGCYQLLSITQAVSTTSDPDLHKDYTFYNFYGSTRQYNIYFSGNYWNNMNISNFIIDDTASYFTNHLRVQGGTVVGTSVSDLYLAPSGDVFVNVGGDIDEFTHTENILY